ncbi:GspMb/PilO family protein [Rugamonas sp. CCM 8940]|uniref:GspMb/PilO family protein n=1 Tax=Rugamonas sp. CCM 8940 TaxID=2765359 RepID=UPI0018F2E8FC|nr:GspMb/PilO family protein [Rugamonas sp. CCM 8940]MBJ7309623.1 hypothetical protein [Rugamonas sp. CCM 8940]
MAAMNPRPASSLRLPANLAPRLLWQAKRMARRLGAGALGGLAALALAALALWHGADLERRQIGLTRQLAQAARVAAQPVAAAAPGSGDAAAVAAFHAYLPAHEMIPDQLQELVKVAQANGVTLAKADYKAQSEPRGGFTRYQITLPIKADYAKLQAFILAALQALPTLTLDSVALRREQIEAGEVEARIQFQLLVRQRGGRP